MLVDSLIITVMESTGLPPEFSLVDLILSCLSLLQIITKSYMGLSWDRAQDRLKWQKIVAVSCPTQNEKD